MMFTVEYAVLSVSDHGMTGVHPWAVIAVRSAPTEVSPNSVVCRVGSYSTAERIASALNATRT